jgi:hypothetical protein
MSNGLQSRFKVGLSRVAGEKFDIGLVRNSVLVHSFPPFIVDQPPKFSGSGKVHVAGAE